MKEEIKQTFFSCIRLHKDDIREQGFNPDSLDDVDMQRMAEKIGEVSMEVWWIALDSYCEDLGLPKNKNTNVKSIP